MNFALHHYSHWQGCGRGSRIDVFATRKEAEAIEEQLSTCSFCRPGRRHGHSVGVCYEVVPTRKPVTAEVTDQVSVDDYAEELEEREWV
jgi:hypothetical protein